MKKMNKLLALVLAMVMVLGLAASAFAEGENYSITINNSATGHTYEAYQIFAGDLVEETNGEGNVINRILSNIVWGSGITADGQTTLQNEYDNAETKSAAGVAEALNESNAAQFAKDVAGYLSSTKVESTYSDDNKNYTISGLAAGYYLVKDQNGSLTGDNDSYTEYIVRVVSDTTATPKSNVPSFEKKVKDINNSTDDAMTDWQDSADHDIGDKVPFQLKGTVASNYDSYKTYYFAFHDKEEAGLTFDVNSVKVYVDGTRIESGYEVKTTGFTDECTFEVIFQDLKSITSVKGGSVITVEYESTLNNNAVLGEQGNVNKAKLEFSNNPNQEQEGTPETGETPWDNVIVFTYKTVINKVDNKNQSLNGAAFKLEKQIKGTGEAADTWETIKEFSVSEETPVSTFEFTGLDDGTYKLTETVTPAGYNTIDPITFTVTAEHTITWDGSNRNAVLTALSGNKVTGEITFASDKTEGSLSANVVNNAGSTLPETGGIGTTIFYVLGGMLVVCAVVLMVSKKRMSAEG